MLILETQQLTFIQGFMFRDRFPCNGEIGHLSYTDRWQKVRVVAVKGGSQRSQNSQGTELSIDPGALIPSPTLLGVSWSSAGRPGWKPKPRWGFSSRSCYLKGYHETTLWGRARRAWPRNVLVTWISFAMSITVIPSEYFPVSPFTFSSSRSFAQYQVLWPLSMEISPG